MKLLSHFSRVILFSTCTSMSYLSYADTLELGKVNIILYGEVTVSTCGVLESEQNKYIDLGTYSTKNLNRIGNKTLTIPIPFNLRNCLPSIPITLTFSGNKDAFDSELLALDNVVNSAKNVAIEILNPDKKRLPLNIKSETLMADKNGDISTFFYAHYIVTNDNATPGVANANAQFTVQYD